MMSQVLRLFYDFFYMRNKFKTQTDSLMAQKASTQIRACIRRVPGADNDDYVY